VADQGSEGLFSPFLRRRRILAARPHLQGRVLDVGCGSGALALYIPQNAYVGVDTDRQSLAIARANHPKHSFLENLPLVANSFFDTITILAVIEHVKSPAEFVRSLAERLSASPLASIVLTTPHPLFGRIHGSGAKVGLFSRHAYEEHEDLLDRSQLEIVARECNLKLFLYQRFLLGANQLVILRRNKV